MASDEPAGLSFDCVIPAHEKDLQTLEHTVTSLRQCCPAVKRVIIISAAPLAEATPADAEWLDEAAELWPFRRADLEGRGCQPGWLLQQLLKLHAPLLIPDLAPHVLVCDADVVWLQAGGLRFFEPGGVAGPVALPCTFGAEACPPIRSAVDLHRYDAFVPAVLPGLVKPRPGAETAVCHHAPLQRDVVEALFQRVEAAHDGRPFWEVFRDATQACEGRASEYELYHAFAHRLFPQRTSPRPLAFAVVADVEAALRCPPAPALAFLVAHSHLRGLAPEELRDREGIINGNVHVEIARRLAQGHPPELAALLAGSGMF
mmetsp:Transcript_81751/g.226441  ORF Transcript_81751/g.226441 Transcript_81751/m.226441 type:complete len:317 (+) Transcript_81751:60-1010(+)